MDIIKEDWDDRGDRVGLMQDSQNDNTRSRNWFLRLFAISLGIGMLLLVLVVIGFLILALIGGIPPILQG
jgi:hypothetical protein